MDAVRQIADAVLYEGYLLWPYRRSAMKNQQRFSFGNVHPAAFAVEGGDADRCGVQLECLIAGEGGARLEVELRFLHLLGRRPGRARDGRFEAVEELIVGGERHVPWEEATERRVALGPLALEELRTPQRLEVEVQAGEEREQLDGEGVVVRSWEALEGELEASALELRPGLARLTVRLANTSAWQGKARPAALRRSFLSLHVVVRASGAELVSMIDPPPELRELAEDCRNVGLWPVLVGEPGRRDTLLAAPIVLSDYPEVAPESPGDHFDGSEIDELLVRSILALTDDEKREMRETDPRARELLERTSALTPDALMRLHGALRDMRPVEEERGELG